MALAHLRWSQHPAVQAWNQLGPKPLQPNFIEVLQEVRKGNSQSSVYRLHGVGHGGNPVIAKRSTTLNAHVERIIYQEILPLLPISNLTFYGCVGEPGTQYLWLFLEDADGVEFTYTIEEHRKLAACWLGQMHVSAAKISAVSSLPDRGPQHYLEHLRFTRQTILGNLGGMALKTQDLQVTASIAAS
jgi:hypothetical protein